MHHGAGLRALLTKEGRSPEQAAALVAALAAQTADAQLSSRERALLAYARKLSLTPGDMSADDVAALRAAGLDDRAIHDLCAVAAYFAFVNRLADGLGVELEPRFER